MVNLILGTRWILGTSLVALGYPSKLGSTEIWTRIAGFKVQSANHYTIEPHSEVGAPEQGIAFTVFYYISIVLTQV